MSKRANLKVVWAALLGAVAAATMVVTLGFTNPAQAANAGDLDRSFSSDGRVTFDVFGGVHDSGRAVAIQPDGKIVVAGSWPGFASDASGRTFALARFNPDGSLDTVFGSGGRTLVAFPNGAAEAKDVAIQPDGKIVAAGYSHGSRYFALARLESDGDIDPSFSGDGKVETSFGSNDVADAEAVAIQGNGKIVVAGTIWDNLLGGDHDADFALARYETDGTLDTTFSGDGKQTTGFGEDDLAYAVAIQTNIPFDHRTRIVVAGTHGGEFALARYYDNGSLDSGFDGDGKVVTDFGGGSGQAAKGVAIQGNGRIVAAGSKASGGDVDFVLARYATDGDLDASFSGDGKVTTGFGDRERAEDVAIQPDGRIVAAGTHWSLDSDSQDADFAIARYHAFTDNTPPNTTITGGPSGAINSTSASFTFVSSELGSKFQCSLDGASFSSCSSPKSYSNLNDGSHLFRVRAIDAAGNTDLSPAQRSFIVDTIAPKVNSVLPTENATGVPPAANVRATFSEAMSASSITTETIKLFRAGTTTPIAAVVSYDAQTRTATLNPDINLRLGTRYKAVVSTGTRDLTGNQLDQDQDPTNGNQSKRWFFTVRN
jgi:uncharacterized delta-60 repeat protein